jgi:diguanylate cyclase (GGDEF)-like protein
MDEAAARTGGWGDGSLRRPGALGAWALTAVLLVLAVALWGVAGQEVGPGVDVLEIPWWGFAVMFGAAETWVLHVQMSRQAKTISLSDIPLVLGMFYGAVPAVLLGRFVGSMAVFVVHRRQRDPVKLAFNGALVLVDGLAGLAVFHRVGAAPTLSGTSGWVSAYAGVAVFGLVSAVAVGLAIAAYGEVRARDVVEDALFGAAMSACVGTLALVAVSTLALDIDTAWLLAASAVVVVLAYRAYAALSERHVALERLYRFSQVVGRTREVDEVLLSVLQQARELLRAEVAEIAVVLASGDRDAVVTRLGRSGALERDSAPTTAPGSLWSRVLQGGAPVLARRRTGDPELRAYLAERGVREAIIVPLRGESTLRGTLSVTDRRGDVRTFDDGDVRLLETVANHAAVALQNSRLIDQLRHASLHDGLTGLPNRDHLIARLQEALERLDAGGPGRVAALIMDLDGFKDVNDTLGHNHGDQLLVEVADRLVAVVPSGATVARLGGDEFAVVIPAVGGGEDAVAVALRLLGALSRPFRLSDLDIQVSASIGVGLAPDDASDVPTLLKRADVAMYSAKVARDGVRLYDTTLDRHTPERLSMAAELSHAVRSGHVGIAVQPKAVLTSGEVTAVEALARWRRPDDTVVPPGEFIPVAERTGLIRPLTTAVLRSSLSACAGWRAGGHDIGVAVNVSTRMLLDQTLADDVGALLAEYDLPPELLTLEITETSVMTDPEHAMALLRTFHDMGVRLSVDDFGTGYASLSYLQRLPVHEVKIDRTFITDMCSNTDDDAIVRSIIDLGHNLSLNVVAEGVEDAETWSRLTEMGCTSAQGYFLSPPIPVDALMPWFAAR